MQLLTRWLVRVCTKLLCGLLKPSCVSQAPPGIVTQAKDAGLPSKDKAGKGPASVGFSGPAPTDPVQQGRRVQGAPGGSPTSGDGFSPALDPVAPPTPSGDGPGANGR